MFRVQLLLLFVFVALGAVACGGGSGSGGSSSGSSSNAVPDNAAVVVRNVTIPKSRIALLMRQARINYENQSVPFPKPGSLAYRGLRGRAVAFLTVGALYEAKAAKEGITVTDAEVKAEADRDRTLFGKTPAAQKKEMKKQGMTEAELQTQARLKAIEQKVQRRVYANVKITDADVRQDYEKNKQQYTTPATRVIRQILVSSKARAIQLRDQARRDGNFAALAKKFSLDKPTAVAGGRVEIRKGLTQPVFDKVAFSIATGKVSDPIKTQYGWQLLQPIGPVKAAVVVPYTKVASDLRRHVLQTSRESALGAWQLAARNEFCKGDVKFSPGYRPFHDDNPCTASTTNRSAPTAG